MMAFREKTTVLLTGITVLMGIMLVQSFAATVEPEETEEVAPCPLQVMYRTGTVKITQPDGTVILVRKDEPFPDIMPGSSIYVITGILVLGIEGSTIIVESTECIVVSITETGEVIFTAMLGDIDVFTADKKKFTVGTGSSFDTAEEEFTEPPEFGEEVSLAEGTEDPEASPYTP